MTYIVMAYIVMAADQSKGAIADGTANAAPVVEPLPATIICAKRLDNSSVDADRPSNPTVNKDHSPTKVDSKHILDDGSWGRQQHWSC